MGEERCGYCKRLLRDLSHIPCQGRHSAAKNGRTDPECAAQYVQQGWRQVQKLPAVVSPEA